MAKSNLVTFEVKINGKALSDDLPVENLHVVLHAEQESIANVMLLANGSDHQIMDLPADFTAGASIEIFLGNSNDSALVFDGELTAIELKMNHLTGAEYYVSALSERSWEPGTGDTLCLTYGENLLEVDGIAHLDEPVSENRYATEIELKTIGVSDVYPEGLISVKGCGNWFDGEFVATTVVHSVTEGNWTTQVLASN